MPKNFETCYSILSSLTWYRHKCQTQNIIFYSIFLSPLNFILDIFSLFSKISLLTRGLYLSVVLSLYHKVFSLSLSLPSSNQNPSPHRSSLPQINSGSSLLPSLPPSLILVWRLHRYWFEAAIAAIATSV